MPDARPPLWSCEGLCYLLPTYLLLLFAIDRENEREALAHTAVATANRMQAHTLSEYGYVPIYLAKATCFTPTLRGRPGMRE